MALIEVFHVVASEIPINTAGANLPQGTIVAIDSSGLVIRCDGNSTTQFAVGIAGDSLSTGVTSFTAESGSALSRNPTSSLTGALVMGARGTSHRFTQNRVADNYNETLASGKMTVYHSGGQFWTDQYELVQSDGTTLTTFHIGGRLYASRDAETVNAALEPEGQAAGRFTDQAGGAGTAGAEVLGITIAAPVDYPSGVPGTDVGFASSLGMGEGGNSLTWGRMLHVLLKI